MSKFCKEDGGKCCRKATNWRVWKLQEEEEKVGGYGETVDHNLSILTIAVKIQKEIAEKKVNLGNPGLTALWNLHPDNLEACRAKDRDFLPSLENYFEEAIEQLDPKNEVNKSKQKVRTKNILFSD